MSRLTGQPELLHLFWYSAGYLLDPPSRRMPQRYLITRTDDYGHPSNEAETEVSKTIEVNADNGGQNDT